MKKRKKGYNPERSRRAFTLIELLVVVAIVGILAMVIILNVSKARARAADAKRKDDIAQIVKAIRMYDTDHGQYPVSGFFYYDYSTNLSGNWRFLSSSLQPYLANFPKDPKNAVLYRYYYRTKSTTVANDWFVVYAQTLESTNDSQNCGNKPFSYSYNSFTSSYVSCTNTSSLSNSFGISSDR